MPNHYGVLYYVKTKDYRFHDVRMPHRRCRLCGRVLQDYGGKKAQMHPFGPLVSDVWTDLHRIRHGTRRDAHPCQLPVPILERLILMSSDEGDIVLDPFVGTGTTAVAARRLGRHYVGIELDEHYKAIAERNLEVAPETRIAGLPVSIYLGRVVTMRDADWASLAKEFFVPSTPLELQAREARALSLQKRSRPIAKIRHNQEALFCGCGRSAVSAW
jgi:site-specific DNA-methyltransferase (adenine-specific)